jgi:hypothetical protein
VGVRRLVIEAPHWGERLLNSYIAKYSDAIYEAMLDWSQRSPLNRPEYALSTSAPSTPSPRRRSTPLVVLGVIGVSLFRHINFKFNRIYSEFCSIFMFMSLYCGRNDAFHDGQYCAVRVGKLRSLGSGTDDCFVRRVFLCRRSATRRRWRW